MDQTQQFLTDLENMSAEDVRSNFFGLFKEALVIEAAEKRNGEDDGEGSASGQEAASES